MTENEMTIFDTVSAYMQIIISKHTEYSHFFYEKMFGVRNYI